jgi:glycosyltransferase involved in cell wall biosynthesis
MTEPLVSVILPTLNAERYLDECLGALRAQDWPRERLEIVLADGGSTDRTLEIAETHSVDQLVPNPRKTGEAGKAEAIRHAQGDLLCSIDSDNVVVGADWLRRMTAPFVHPGVVGAEVARFDYRRQDHPINRWHALTGVADPLTLYTGNYARDSLLTGTWTAMPFESEARDGWELIRLRPGGVPVLGANGFIVRRSAFDLVRLGDYFFDLDFVAELVAAGHVTFARVNAAIRHYFCDGVRGYVRKTRRRADDFLYFASEGERSYDWTSEARRRGILRFVVATVLVVPLIWDVLRGMRRRRDMAWWFHLPACWLTLAIYAVAMVRSRMTPRMLDRSGWRQ